MGESERKKIAKITAWENNFPVEKANKY